MHVPPSEDWAAVIPTRNGRPEMLRKLVAVIGPSRMVIVHTAPMDISPDLDGCLNVRYEGELNIQAWWKKGIEAAGSRYVALINDDVEMQDNIVPTMVQECWNHGRSLARLYGPHIRASGFLFVIDTSHDLMPDTRFRWWWGDDDLYQQAKHKHGIINVLGTGVKHEENGVPSPEFEPIIRADRTSYIQKWHPDAQ